MLMNLVSFSLYGTAKRYLQGAVENAILMPKIYPGWTMRVYCADDIDSTPLKDLGCQIEYMGVSHDQSGMLWRFLPAWDASFHRVIFRDADSRINPREAAAVQEWIDSGLDAHCMHDHPHHTSLPVMGGMWGIKCGILPNMMIQWTRWMSGLQRRRSDMVLLRESVYPCIKDSLMCHSSVPVPWPHQTFPSHEAWEGFVGQQIDDDGLPMWAGLTPSVRTGGEMRVIVS